METEIQRLAAEWDRLERSLEENPLSPDDIARARAAIRTSWKPRLAHHLLMIRRGDGSVSNDSLAWVLNYFDEQQREISRLRKYQYNVRKAIKALQAAYESKSRLLAAAVGTGPRELVMAVLSELGIRKNPPVEQRAPEQQGRYS